MIKGSKIAIYGFGKEGFSAANYLGKENQIAIIDDRPKNEIDVDFFKKLKVSEVNFFFNGQLPENLAFDFVVRSPSVRPDHPSLIQLVNRGAVVTSPTQIFFDESPAKIIGVTGTKGKGTTATLIYQMLKQQYSSVFLAGNIGLPALDILPQLAKESLVILELSSFQLFDLDTSPHIAVILMITQEHLDWHLNKSEYRQAKESIVKNQKKGDFAVINQDFPISRSFAKKTQAKVYFVSTEKQTNGVYIQNKKIFSKISTRQMISRLDQILLPGAHNWQNVIAATAVAKILKVPKFTIVGVLSTFKGLIHRLELIREVSLVKFYNDSFSTTPETTIAAIKAIDGSKILILGGSSKNSDFSKLAKIITERSDIKAIVLIGQEATKIKEAINRRDPYSGKLVEGAQNMETIVTISYQLARPGDSVVLSPACASLDMFKNYQDRGVQFTNCVKKLKKREELSREDE